MPISALPDHLKNPDNWKERCLSKVRKTGACWLWTANRDRRGYGLIHIRPRTILAHRLFYEFYRGSIPTRQCVCHRCDVPSCVNPAHLFLGTRSENMQDCFSKKRGPRQKLSKDDVIRIRQLYYPRVMTRSMLAEIYAVSVGHIDSILWKNSWRWI